MIQEIKGKYELRVAVIDIDELTKKQSDIDYYTISNEQFLDIAEEQGTVYSMSGFSAAFNDACISTDSDVLRFILVHVDTGEVLDTRMDIDTRGLVVRMGFIGT